ncbi:MAG: hypothetical protein CMK09_09195 [Ponticaulis sp.]|nr:hypothetical protein [Ponticaulis sp.]|tara:strand:- start:7776 stop:8303 length:528 start_codon:yes stop_codon:yes gene_type:complete
MTPPPDIDSLRAKLADFDGNAVSYLSETAAGFRDDPDFHLACLHLMADLAPLIQRGASWIWLDHVRTAKTITPAELDQLLPVLDQITDWGAALHLLQAFDHYPGGSTDPAQLARFFDTYLGHKRPFLRAWAVNALCRLAIYHTAFKPAAQAAHADALKDPAASVRARARKISLPD